MPSVSLEDTAEFSGCRLGKMVTEQSASSRQFVYIGNLDRRMAECRQTFPAPLIGSNEKQVGHFFCLNEFRAFPGGR